MSENRRFKVRGRKGRGYLLAHSFEGLECPSSSGGEGVDLQMLCSEFLASELKWFLAAKNSHSHCRTDCENCKFSNLFSPENVEMQV